MLSDRAATAAHARFELCDFFVGAVFTVRRITDQSQALEHVVETRRLEIDDARLAGKRARGGADFRLGDGTHVAQGLRHDQIGLQICQQGQVERVESPLGLQSLADEGVDLAARWRLRG